MAYVGVVGDGVVGVVGVGDGVGVVVVVVVVVVGGGGGGGGGVVVAVEDFYVFRFVLSQLRSSILRHPIDFT